MRRALASFALGAALVSAPVAAQSPDPASPSPVPTSSPMPVRVTLCLVIDATPGANLANPGGMMDALVSGVASIVDVLVPAQCPAAAAPADTTPTIGAPQNVDGRALVTVKRVKFSKAVPDPPFSPIKPDPGKVFMSVLVQVEATSDGVRTCANDWSAYAGDVVQSRASLGRDAAAYLPCAAVPNGRTAKGWVDFQVPARKGGQIDVAYTLGTLTGAPGFTITTRCCSSR